MSDGGCLSTLDGLGPFIEEICIPPGMHVLNGAVFGYWGMRDLVLSGLAEPGQRDCADEVLRCVAAALPRFSLRWNWSKYDVATRTVASREYHRLHAAQAHVLARQSASPEASHIAAAWEGADTFVIALWYSLGKGGRESLRRLFHLRRHALQQQAVR
jgi:hypothetical protein